MRPDSRASAAMAVMNARSRASSTGSRIGTHAFRRPFEAHQPSDQRVVTRVGGIGVLLRKLCVKSILRKVRRVVAWNVETEAAKARRADENEQRLDRLRARGKIAQALFDQIGAGKCVVDVHHSANRELQ